MVKLSIGTLLIAGLAIFLGSGPLPPGHFGDVIRHNRERGIDATPLFYSEVENMADLEDALARSRAAASAPARAIRSEE